jgi:predicted DNA-binding transcriptional regulator YafY
VADPEVLLAIATACRDHERLRFGYRSHGDEHSRRHIEPHTLVHTGRRWYLVAWDVDRDDWRTFRVDRIERAPTPQRRFHPRPLPADDIAAYVARRVAAARDRFQVEVILHAPLDVVAARVPYGAATLEPIGSHRCRLSTGADWLDRLAVSIAMIGVEFEVVSPPELTERIARLGELFARAAGRSPVAPTASPSSRTPS